MLLRVQIHFRLIAILAGIFLGSFSLVVAQKDIIKGPVSKPDSLVKAPGKGSIKGAASTIQDTLIGGDGFIPRTVIDSFPRMGRDSVAVRLGTNVTPAQLKAAKLRIVELREKIAIGDSVVAIKRMDPSPDWPETRVEELAIALASLKQQLSEAEKQLTALEKRYKDTAARYTAPTNFKPESATSPSKPKSEPAAKPSSPAASPPSNAPTTGSSGKAGIKGGN